MDVNQLRACLQDTLTSQQLCQHVVDERSSVDRVISRVGFSGDR